MISEMTDYTQDGSRFPSEAGIFVLATVSIPVVGGGNQLPTQRVGIKR